MHLERWTPEELVVGSSCETLLERHSEGANPLFVLCGGW